MLLKAGADVNAATNYMCGETPLHRAAHTGSETCVALLLEAGADVNAANTDGWCRPLFKAAYHGGEACVSLLLEAGADVNATYVNGEPAWHNTIAHCCTAVVAALAAAVPRLDVPPHLLRPSPQDEAALADPSAWHHWQAMQRQERRPATIAVLQRESRWRRRRPLALIREQRRAVRDAGLVHKEWEREQEAKRRRK